MFKNNRGFSTFETLFACHLFLFAALVLMPAYEKLMMGKKEVRAKLEAYQVLHEQMNEAFINGTTSSIKKKRGEITYVFNWRKQKGCVSYKVQKKRPYAFGMWSDDKAFTLLQALWQLQLFLFLSFGCGLIFSAAEKARPFEDINGFSQMEWKQTVLQLDEELSRADAVKSVKGGKVLEYISDQGRVVTIEPYQEMLRKRTDQAGHLPLLHKVKQFHVRTSQHRAILKVTDGSGKVYEAVFFTYKGMVRKS